MTKSVAQVITENPNLPIYTAIDGECCGDEVWYLGTVVSARVTKVTVHPAGAYNSDSRWWEYEDKDELCEYIFDDPKTYIEGLDLVTHTRVFWFEYCGEQISEERAVEIANDYIEALDWQECILLRVGV